MSKKEERLNQIFSLLEEVENIHIKDLAIKLNVSEMTIRRDICASESLPVRLLGGHVILTDERKSNPRYFLAEHEAVRIEEKKHIGILAAKLVENNDTVFFDCGTTPAHIIKYIPDSIQFTAICYSLNVFLLLQNKPNCQIILCGGQFHDTNGIFSSIGNTTSLDSIYPTKAFISAAGISEKGMTCFHLNEVFWKKKAIQNANYKILIADSSKFGETRSAHFGYIEDINLLITNQVDDEYKDFFAKHKITVMT